MNIICFPTGPLSTNCYVLSCPETHEAVIIDPGLGSFTKIIQEIKKHQLKPIAIWLTHTHWDHIGEAAKIKKEFSIPIYVHQEDHYNLENPGSDRVPMIGPSIEGVVADHLLKEGDFLTIGKISFRVIHTPGHSPGGVCFYSEQQKTLISGDTFFQRSIGTLNLPTSEPDRMWPSLEKLAVLPSDTTVFPGHGPKTTIGDEKWLKNAKKIFG